MSLIKNEINVTTTVLLSLTESKIPADVQELLVQGNPDLGVAPGALKKALSELLRVLNASESRTLALYKTLKFARVCLNDAPEHTWGYDMIGDPDVPGGTRTFSKKDEYLDHIDRVLNSSVFEDLQ